MFREKFTCYYEKGVIDVKQKHIDASREVRLWIGQIIIPAMTFAATTLAIPEVRQAVATKANQWKWSIKNKLRKD